MKLLDRADFWKFVALGGGLCWLLLLGVLHPVPLHTEWAWLLLLLAPLVLVPLGLRLLEHQPVAVVRWLLPPSALLLGISFLQNPGWPAGLLALPWLATTAVIALTGFLPVLQGRVRSPADLSIHAGLIYLVIGASWTLLARLDIRPLYFEPIIVLLTGIHFHYAGFVLPLLTGLAAKEHDDRLARVTCLGVVASVPLVAIGITATQLGSGPVLECLAAWLMSLFGLLVAWLHLRLAARSTYPRHVRIGWFVAGVVLALGMVLSTLYGARAYFPIDWLDIPWMRALHGSGNALGFGLVGLLSWNACVSRRPAV
jgi:hypothetical protein